MAQNYIWPSVSVSATNPSVGVNGQPIPTSATLVAGENPSTNLEPLQTDSSGNLLVNIAASSGGGSPLPTKDQADGPVTPGAVAANSILIGAQFNTALPTLATGQQAALQADSSARLILSPLTNSSTVTVVQPTGTNLHTVVDSGTVVVTQPTAASLNATVVQATPANLQSQVSQPTASALNATVVQGTASNLLSEVSQPTASALNATVVQSLGTNLHVNVDNFPASQVVSQPTAANLNATVVGSGNFTVVQPTGTNLHAVIDSAPSPTGRAQSNVPVYNVYSSTNITTSAYVELIASTSSTTNYLDIFDSSGQAMILATGAMGSEVIQAYIPPGGDQIPLAIPAGTRIAYQALTANAVAGYLIINLYG